MGSQLWRIFLDGRRFLDQVLLTINLGWEHVKVS
jgi:hypothetical protein